MRADRQRYVVFAADPKTTFNDLERFLKNMDPGEKSFRLIQYDEREGKGIIRCPHARLDRIRALEGSCLAIRILGVSGTIKRARMKFLRSREHGLR